MITKFLFVANANIVTMVKSIKPDITYKKSSQVQLYTKGQYI